MGKNSTRAIIDASIYDRCTDLLVKLHHGSGSVCGRHTCTHCGAEWVGNFFGWYGYLLSDFCPINSVYYYANAWKMLFRSISFPMSRLCNLSLTIEYGFSQSLQNDFSIQKPSRKEGRTIRFRRTSARGARRGNRPPLCDERKKIADVRHWTVPATIHFMWISYTFVLTVSAISRANGQTMCQACLTIQ